MKHLVQEIKGIENIAELSQYLLERVNVGHASILLDQSFTCEISGNILMPGRTQYNISISEVEKALAYVPFNGPAVVNDIVSLPDFS